jgi:hypothetical protein
VGVWDKDKSDCNNGEGDADTNFLLQFQRSFEVRGFDFHTIVESKFDVNNVRETENLLGRGKCMNGKSRT